MLALVMTLSVNGISAQAATSSEGIRITDEKITTETTSIHVNLDRVASTGILRVVEMEADEVYEEGKLNTYTSLNLSFMGNLQEGDNVLTLSASPSEGMKVVAVMRDAGQDETVDYVSNALIVEKAGSGSEQPTTPEGDISKNCSVKLLRTESFTEADTSVDVEVNLDPSLTDGCYMTIFGYSSNMSFDPDMVYNERLWSGKVSSGTITCTFNQKLQKYHNVIACLNVPVGEDNYRSVVSQAIEVVDENGSGFQDYTYPDVKIDEDTLVEGATTLHITLTGDERLFAAAQAGQTSITCAVGQYPADETFDFEGEHQISLAGNIDGSQSFSGKEITLNEPLKAGYRVRAVVYWSQNKDIFLAKGNDYEEAFHRPDDSVPVSAASSADDPEVTVGTITEGKDFAVTLKGDAPSGSMLIIKSYPADTEAFAMNQGTLVAAVQNAEAGTITVSPNAGSVSAGRKVVVFWHNAGNIIASSEPVTVQEPVPFEVTTDGMLLAGATSVTFHVKALVAVNDNNINVTRLCRIAGDGKPDTANPLAVRYRQNPGDITFDGLDALQAGDRVCLSFTYMKDDQVKNFTSDVFPVVAEDSIIIQQTSFTTDAKNADIVVKGCEVFQDGYLFVSVGAPGADKDSRTRLASVKFTGEGTYTVTFSGNVQLKAGQTILAYLYKYDADADRIDTKEATEIPVTVRYSDEYLSLGDEFYCDVSIYQFSAEYTDDEFEKNELWENYNKTKVVAKANSRQGALTNGSLKIPVLSSAKLNAGDRLIIKLRLPHTEWEGEEVDYIFTSIPVLPAGEETPDYKVVLYNLGDDSSRGDRVRKILDKIGVPTETMEYAHLNETVGYLAGLDGYEAAKSAWTGATFDAEFMLLCNLPESLLDRFLDEMQANGLRIDHKAIVTEYNREYEFHELIEDIKEEHNTFQVLIALNSLVKDAEKLDEKVYGTSKDWQAFRKAIADANAVIGSYEPSEEELTAAYNALKELYLRLTEKKEMQGTAIITVEQNENGTYRLTASVKGGVERAAYEYRWRTGETGPVVDQVSAENLIGSTVEVSREDLYGTLKAQLQVPEAPKAAIIAGTDYMKVTWNAPVQADNQPLPENYVVSVYKEGVLVKEITCAGDATEALVDGLEVQTGYIVKVAAVSPVGRSDRAVLAAQTQEKPSINPGDNGNQDNGNGNNNGGQNGGNSNNGNNGNGSNTNNGSNGSNGNNSNGSGNGSSGNNSNGSGNSSGGSGPNGSGSSSSNTDNGGSSSCAVKTGDNTPWELYLAGLLASAAIAAAVSRKRRAK